MNEPLRVLLTGFEPFGGHQRNISAEVATALSGLQTISNPWNKKEILIQVEIEILTVDEPGSLKIAQRLRNGERWDAILHLGLCEQCEQPRIERLARNELNMRIPDNRGRLLRNQPITNGGHRGTWVDPTIWPAQFFPSPYSISTDAGAFLCNETYFRTLHALADQPVTQSLPIPCIFVHLPSETILNRPQSSGFVAKCLQHLLFPYPEDIVHVVAALLPIDEFNHLVVQKHHEESQHCVWEYPGGKCKPDEDLMHAIKRELQEELSLEVKPEQLLGTWVSQQNDSWFAVHLIKCDWSRITDDIHLTEHSDWKSISVIEQSLLKWHGRDEEMYQFLCSLALKPS